MSLTIGIVLIAVLIALIVISRRNKPVTVTRPPLPARSSQAKPTTRFHAVSIQFAENACEAAKNMEGKRFLAAAAPRIPLRECNVLECKCRFIHHEDRRSGIERRGQYVPNRLATAGGYDGKERRYRGDRRDNEAPNLFS